MVNFLLYILAGVGLSHILADGSIFSSFKFWLSEESNWFTRSLFCQKFLQMLNCYQCNGWHSGLIVAILGYFNLTWLLWAFAISLVSPLFGYFKLYLDILTSVDEKHEE